GEEDVGGHAGGKMDVQPESASSDFPVDHHGPAEALPRCLDPGEVADGLRANLDVAQSGVLWAYAGQAGVEPLLDVTKHEVILRAIGIGVPGLGERSGAAGDLTSIAWGESRCGAVRGPVGVCRPGRRRTTPRCDQA